MQMTKVRKQINDLFIKKGNKALIIELINFTDILEKVLCQEKKRFLHSQLHQLEKIKTINKKNLESKLKEQKKQNEFLMNRSGGKIKIDSEMIQNKESSQKGFFFNKSEKNKGVQNPNDGILNYDKYLKEQFENNIQVNTKSVNSCWEYQKAILEIINNPSDDATKNQIMYF